MKIIVSIKKYFVVWGGGLLLALASVGSAVPVAAQQDLFKKACSNANSAICDSSSEGKTRDDAAGRVKDVINTILYVLGIVAVIMIVIGGFRYVTSNGEQNNVSQGKNTILYAVIGLIVAILSYTIVNFVIFRLQ